ncbi:MAG: RNA polymerase sigma factor RpoH [Gammaproteobacteria bacterium]|nr:RNA polymerase sigma factor RpoH [Gammaproteobacteria bacterium]
MSNELAIKNQDFAMLIPNGNLSGYMQTASRIDMLSAEEEQDLAWRLFNHGDIDAARKMVLSHLRFVIHIARGYNGYGLPLGDLIQEGNVGLMKAVKRFDPNVGVRLVSFAVHWIRSEIHEFILKNWRIVKIATTKAQRKLFFNLRSAKKRLGWFSHAEVNTVAEELGVKPEVVLEMEKRLSGTDIGFDLRNEEDDEQASFSAPASYLQDQRTDPALEIELQDTEDQDKQQLYRAMKQLDERSQIILQQRWLGEKKTTLQDLATRFGVSAERIRQLEKNAMNKLKLQITI